MPWYKISYIAIPAGERLTTAESMMINVENKSAAAKVLLALIRKRKGDDSAEGITRAYKPFIELKPNWNQSDKVSLEAPSAGNCQSIWGPFDEF